MRAGMFGLFASLYCLDSFGYGGALRSSAAYGHGAGCARVWENLHDDL